MTALAQRRRWVAVRSGAIVGVLAVVAVLFTVVGVSTLANSTIGSAVQAPGPPVRELPFTPTALWGVTDDDGDLRALAIVVGDPSGSGGTIVVLDPMADVSGGQGAPSQTLGEAFAAGGTSGLVGDVEAMVGVALDVADVTGVADVVAVVSSAEFAPATLDDLGAVRTVHRHVWDQVADALGSRVVSDASDRVGRGSADDPASGGSDTTATSVLAAPESLVDLVEPLSAGTVQVVELPVIDDESALAGGSVVYHDPSQTLLIMAHLAPTRVATPFDSATVRVVSAIDDESAARAGMTPAAVVVRMIDVFRYVGVNVASVSTEDAARDDVGDVPEVTEIWVPDTDRHAAVEEAFKQLLGPVTVREGDYRVPGIDMVIVVGQSFVDRLAAGAG